MGKRGLNDFWDWISPMVARELRQGTRTHIFPGAFILMLVALVIVMLTSLAAGGTDATEGFWLCVGFIFVIVMPLRGISAISTEEKLQTMDMLLLTRLSAGKIIFGKWAALFSQTLLLASALLPFVVLRYFLGGIDLAGEAFRLLMLVTVSGVLTAFAVCLSTLRSIVLRGIIVVAIAYLIVSTTRHTGAPSFDSPEFVTFLVKFLLICAFSGYFLLSMGASQFAPMSENHAARKRLIEILYLVIFLLSLMFCFLVGNFGEGFFLWVLFPIPVSSVLLLEGRDHWGNYGAILALSLVSTGCWIALLICRIIPVLREFKAVETECLALIEKEKAVRS